MNKERGSIIRGALGFVTLCTVGIYVLFYVIFGYSIPPGSIGIRQIKMGPLQGFSSVGLKPGLHWGDPLHLYSVVYLIPQTIQALHFHREAGDLGSGLPSLEIQTADRATVDVDITVLSRFYSSPGAADGVAHGGPANLVLKVGVQPDDWQNHIRRTAEDQLKRALGTISTGDFYNPHLREKALEVAQKKMQEQLGPDGIEIEALLLRRYTYRDERIDQAIFQKNLQDQEERLNVQASKLAEAQAALEQVSAEWDAKIQTLRVNGENKARVLKSEGDLYENEKRSQADLEIAKAKAEVDKLKAGALGQSSGAEVYVARELSSLLSSIKGGVVSDLDPYDLKAWTERMGVSGGAK